MSVSHNSSSNDLDPGFEVSFKFSNNKCNKCSEEKNLRVTYSKGIGIIKSNEKVIEYYNLASLEKRINDNFFNYLNNKCEMCPDCKVTECSDCENCKEFITSLKSTNDTFNCEKYKFLHSLTILNNKILRKINCNSSLKNLRILNCSYPNPEVNLGDAVLRQYEFVISPFAIIPNKIKRN